MSALGNHILVEFTGCSPSIMNDISLIEKGMVEAAGEVDETLLNSNFHHFSPYGISGVVVVPDRFLAIHTWPEYGYAAVDLFAYGAQEEPWQSFNHLQEVFKSTSFSTLEIKRGSEDLIKRLNFDLPKMRQEVREQIKPDEKLARCTWFNDVDDDTVLSVKLKGDALYDEESQFQSIQVYDTYAYGKMLVIDETIMTTERDEYHYHEMIAHPAIFTHGNVRDVLVIGGGDGGSVREVLRHESVERVVQIELDELVVEACKKHMPTLSSAYDHPKLELLHQDGIAYVKNALEGSFDLVIVDGCDPVGPSKELFSKMFYKHIHRILREKGIVIVQGEAPRYEEETYVSLHQLLKELFDSAFVNIFNVPTYTTGMWSFQWGIKGDINPKDFAEEEKVEKFVIDNDLQVYNFDMHHASLALPNFVKKMLNDKIS